jgi:hypothetical protein
MMATSGRRARRDVPRGDALEERRRTGTIGEMEAGASGEAAAMRMPAVMIGGALVGRTGTGHAQRGGIDAGQRSGGDGLAGRLARAGVARDRQQRREQQGEAGASMRRPQG